MLRMMELYGLDLGFSGVNNMYVKLGDGHYPFLETSHEFSFAHLNGHSGKTSPYIEKRILFHDAKF